MTILIVGVFKMALILIGKGKYLKGMKETLIAHSHKSIHHEISKIISMDYCHFRMILI